MLKFSKEEDNNQERLAALRGGRELHMKKIRFVFSFVMMMALSTFCTLSAYAAPVGRVLSPYTGDESNVPLLVVLVCVSAAVLIGVLVYIKRAKKNPAAQDELAENPTQDEDKGE